MNERTWEEINKDMDIMKVLFMHQEECSEELRGIERKINAINELLGGM